ncbi:cholesterol 24-hydroxylase isoform X2 [Ascaphus truei]|uniref:cholesterol 24-hydroxylase isoform X2 n=1 Tax=Ascaphus truei TaxID=8439 RepID=UPI003F592632
MGLWTLVTWASLLLLALALIGFLLFCGYIKYIHMKYDHMPGPPRDSFFLGHFPTIMRLTNNNEVIYDQFLDWVLKYGPVIRINGFSSVFVLVVSPEGVKEFLMSAKYPKDVFYDRIFSLFGVRFMGKGLVTDTDYDHWHKQRKMMDPAFSRTYLMGLMGPFNEKAEELMETLAEKADGKSEVKMHDMMRKLTLDVIAKVAFGMELNSLQNDKTPFPRAISMVMKGLLESRNPLAKFLPSKQAFIRDVRECVKLLRQTGKECIEKRLRLIQDGEEIPVDILTQILKGAGQETTANQLSFAVLELARHPEILERVQAEIDEVIGSKRDINYEDLGKLQYLSQVLKETLRLYPTAPGTTRRLEEETVIEGVRIPGNATLMFNSYIMGRMEQFYTDPLSFDPERFSPDAPKPYFTYFPFSLGPRSCIGQAFAQVK